MSSLYAPACSDSRVTVPEAHALIQHSVHMTVVILYVCVTCVCVYIYVCICVCALNQLDFFLQIRSISLSLSKSKQSDLFYKSNQSFSLGSQISLSLYNSNQSVFLFKNQIFVYKSNQLVFSLTNQIIQSFSLQIKLMSFSLQIKSISLSLYKWNRSILVSLFRELRLVSHTGIGRHPSPNFQLWWQKRRTTPSTMVPPTTDITQPEAQDRDSSIIHRLGTRTSFTNKFC